MKKILAVLASLFALTGCGPHKTEDYAANTPKMDIREYLNGDIDAWGIVFDMFGRQDVRFHVAMKASWQGNKGRFEEHFNFSDGRKDERIWDIILSDDNHFTATAHDVVGTAIGTQHGNAANMKYVLTIPRGNSSIDLDLDDWLFRMDEKTVISRTYMRKFGLKVGELMVVFTKK